MNTLIVIGYLGGKRAYLNVDEDEAIARYVGYEGAVYTFDELREVEIRARRQMTTFTFDDEFEVYDAGSVV